MLTRLFFATLAVTTYGLNAYGEDLPKGKLVDGVKCLADASQSYALYLPSNYSPNRKWNVLLAFDAGGRGSRGVERFQAAAEKYGYIVAGSNNSRNGPWEVSMSAAAAMSADVRQRFSVNPKRIYATGQSGGARVAMRVAMETKQIAGVIASSAIYPGDEPLEMLDFPVFATAGTEDFNYLELRQADRQLVSPHRLVIFEGGHTWLSSELATEALGWMELQAMKSGLRPRDEALIRSTFHARAAQANAQKGILDSYLALASLVLDFQGLQDMSKYAARVAALQPADGLKEAMIKVVAEEREEEKMAAELSRLEGDYFSADEEKGAAGFRELKTRLLALKAQADGPQDSPARRRARRLIGGIISGTGRIDDPEYRKLLDQIRPSQQQR